MFWHIKKLFPFQSLVPINIPWALTMGPSLDFFFFSQTIKVVWREGCTFVGNFNSTDLVFLGSPYLGKATVAARTMLPSPTSVWSIFRCPVAQLQWLGLLECVLMLMNATAHRGCTNTVRKAALNTDSGGECPLKQWWMKQALVSHLAFTALLQDLSKDRRQHADGACTCVVTSAPGFYCMATGSQYREAATRKWGLLTQSCQPFTRL